MINRKRPLGLSAKCLVIGFLFGLVALLPGFAATVTVKIAAGEYPPFVSQKLPENGITAAIVTAALRAQGVDVTYEFLPWKRGFLATGLTKYAGTFPYLKTAEREVDFLYSEPIFTDIFRLFVRKSDGKERNWTGKSICIPLGYDTTQIQSFTTQNKITLERPSEISKCFNMLNVGHVEAVWVSELVGYDMVKTLFGRNSELYPLEMSLVGNTKYYFIISKKLPDAEKWMTRFNAGLKLIRENGNYKQIQARFSFN